MRTNILIASAAIAALGTAAAADSYFTYIDNEPQQADSTIELGEVVADADGTVVIYEYNGGEFGEMLGSTPVAAGANSDVEVNVGTAPQVDVAAVLYIGEMTDMMTPDTAAAWVEIDLEGDSMGDD
ncbi:hypothetical protein [Pelagovum pacificum]|uniref:Uncharacterized protein n=1 Tax=Pelagovum pacificum TaxID=2588711 RepID=A0A5C5GED7_9RHOB|nr:hypothetical protein [Pelagovum pacificum]QQA44558.1 hypothetical protein I8N54_08325 [Pelagovum pacificum]TNY32329.1 hypothetical protein FHY64_03265 [Pelagovum pacificum]